MKPVSLADISYEQGLQLLALRKQAMATGQLRRMPPEALANSFPLRNIGQATIEKLAEGGILDRLNSGIKDVSERYHRLDPSVRNTLNMAAAGTGVGAVAGLGSAIRRGDKSYGRSALRGGIAGAGLGGGLGLALNREKLVPMLQDKAKGLSDKVNPPTDKIAPVNVAGTNATAVDPNAKLKATVNSYRPEAALALEGGGSLVVGGTALRKLNNRKTYSPEDMAEYIRQHVQTPTAPGKGGKPKGPSNVRTSALGDLFGVSNKDAPTVGAGMAENIRKGMTTQEDITGLLETAGHGPTRFGKMKTGPSVFDRNAKDTKKLLENLVGSDKIDDALKASQRGGFIRSNSKYNKPKTALGVLLGLATAAGATDAVTNYAGDVLNRNDALERLSSIINATP